MLQIFDRVKKKKKDFMVLYCQLKISQCKVATKSLFVCLFRSLLTLEELQTFFHRLVIVLVVEEGE